MSPANTFPLITPQGIYQVAIGSQKKTSISALITRKATKTKWGQSEKDFEDKMGRVKKVLLIKSSCESLFESNQSKTEGLKDSQAAEMHN